MDTTLTIKLPKNLRDAAKSTAAAMGLPLTTVIHRQLQDFVDKKEITFMVPVELKVAPARVFSKGVQVKFRAAKRLPKTAWKSVK